MSETSDGPAERGGAEVPWHNCERVSIVRGWRVRAGHQTPSKDAVSPVLYRNWSGTDLADSSRAPLGHSPPTETAIPFPMNNLVLRRCVLAVAGRVNRIQQLVLQ